MSGDRPTVMDYVRGQISRCRYLVLSLLACLAGGCAIAVTSEFESQQIGLGCDNNAGAYFLSKAFIEVRVFTAGENGFRVEEIKTRAEPDQRQAYCIDYRPSPTAVDTFAIQRTTNGLLTRVTTQAEDRSRQIFETIIETVFKGLSGNPNFDRNLRGGERGGRLADSVAFEGKFDPADRHDAAVFNDAINDLGLCFILEGADWDPGAKRPDRINRYCDNPLGRHGLTRAIAKSGSFRNKDEAIRFQNRNLHHRLYRPGILYRPRMAHPLSVYVKKDRQAPHGWQLRHRKIIRIENFSPTLAIGVDRTFFAERNTTLDFNHGALTDVTITKDSELENFVQIPLQVVDSILALPANIVQIKIERTNNRARLIDAQQKLIEAQQSRLAAQTALDRASGNPGLAQQGIPPVTDGGPRLGRIQPGQQSFAANASGGRSSSLIDRLGAQSFPQCLIECQGTGLDSGLCTRRCDCLVRQCPPGADPQTCANLCGRN